MAKSHFYVCGMIVGVVAFATAAPPIQPKAGEPLPGLTPNQRFMFDTGLEYYDTPLLAADGRGPGFNNTSCSACHSTPLGGWGEISVTHFGNRLPNGDFDFLTSLGGPVFQSQALSPGCAEVLPDVSIANHVRTRVTPSVLAFGLVEAIPDASIIANEDPEDLNQDGISGRAHRVHPIENPTITRIGRFGWKAQIATVLSFSGDAARNEMGLTNRIVPEETAPNGDPALLAQCDAVAEIEDKADEHGITFIDGVTAFQRYLGQPPQSPRSGMSGEVIFNNVGCAQCHTPSFTTSNDTSLEAAIRGKTIRIYSDFLLHDMGSTADGIPDGEASGSEMKTPPLWNLRTRPFLIHSHETSVPSNLSFQERVEIAIAAHAGEGFTSRSAYLSLSNSDKSKVISFLDSLGRNDYDIDGNGDVELNDYAQILAHVTDTDVSPDEAWAVADLNQNHKIDADEIEQLQALLEIDGDCNQNGINDWRDISSGLSLDTNQNGSPDECDGLICTQRTLQAQGLGGPIPGGNQGLSKVITLPTTKQGTLFALRLTLQIKHDWLQDLTITLKHGTDTVTIQSPSCGGFHDIDGSYVFTDAKWNNVVLVGLCQGSTTDRGGSNEETRFLINPGTFKFTGSINTLIQDQIAGAWTLNIKDSQFRNTNGLLKDWKLEIRYDDSTETADCNENGTPDCSEIDNVELNCDQNDVLDSCELDFPFTGNDQNGNGILDRCEIAAGDQSDCDGDGIFDSLELDSDGDGVPDDCDGCPNNAGLIVPGPCGCGSVNGDDDFDGVPNCLDGCPTDRFKTSPGECGCGIPDIDTDRDGTFDCFDLCPNDPNKIAPGQCGCGVPDVDTDGDGTADCNDLCPNDPNKIAPGQCGCGVPDVDTDGDGKSDCVDLCPNDPNKIAPGNCGCGNPETADCGDSDGDGVPNGQDGCPADPNKNAPGICGCGTPDIDSDNDGTLDCQDQCPNDPNKITPGACGCGILDTDADGNGIPDCLESGGLAIGQVENPLAANGAGFGWSVDVDGEYAIAGARNQPINGAANQGMASILHRQANGQWASQAILLAPNGVAGDGFGARVSLSDRIAVVTAPNAQSAKGVAYIFERNDTTNDWTFVQQIQAADALASDNFGNSVSISNGVIAVGASRANVGANFDQGAVYVFSKSGSNVWTQETKLIASDGSALDGLGNSVSLEDGLLVSGAPFDDTGSMNNHGSAYLFRRISAGNWVQRAKISAGTESANALFGREVGTDGDSIVINAPDQNGGAAYVYGVTGTTDTVSAATSLIAPNVISGAAYAGCVSISGNRLLVAAGFDTVGTEFRAGSVYVFVKNQQNAWVHKDKLVQSNASTGDFFGWVAAIDKDMVIVGAVGDNTDSVSDAGSVSFFDLNPADCDDDGIPDVDSDGDGIADCSDTDNDNDGTADVSDLCPRDPLKTAPGTCGCGVTDSNVDTDQDGVIDCIDNCPFAANSNQSDCDNNGKGDVCEPQLDCNGNGLLDSCDIATGKSTDFNFNGIPDECEPATIKVPSQFATIQSAINAAPSDGIILVSPGIYSGSINTQGKAVKIHGRGGPNVTILDGAAVLTSLVIFQNGEGPGTVLSGFTVRRGTNGTPLSPGSQFKVGGGIYVNQCSPTIVNCVISQCRGEYGGGMYLLYSSSFIDRCVFKNNAAIEYGGGLQAFGGSVHMQDCIFDDNVCGFNGGGMHLVGGALKLLRCTISNNVSLTSGGGISWDCAITTTPTVNVPLEMSNCVLEDNFAVFDGGGAYFWGLNTGAPPASIIGSLLCGNVPDEYFGPAILTGITEICSDCNLNGTPDADDIAVNPTLDCNSNGRIDTCEVAAGLVPDRNKNGTPDECEESTRFVPSEYSSIGSAVTAAQPGDTVWIAPGVYSETINVKGKAITIKGGGPEPVIIDGSNINDSLFIATTNETPDTVIDGIVFRNGRVGSTLLIAPSIRVGGGAYVDNASPTFRNCIFEQCLSQYGGGAYFIHFSGRIESCVFQFNSAIQDGGGLQLNNCAATVVDCRFDLNVATRWGGGLHIDFGNNQIFSSVMQQNQAINEFGGGVSWYGGATPPMPTSLKLNNCEIDLNQSLKSSGGLFVWGAMNSSSPPAIITDSMICDNFPDDISGSWTDNGGNNLCNCVFDLDRSGIVDSADVSLALLDIGPCAACSTDVDGSGNVDSADIALLLLNAGPCQ